MALKIEGVICHGKDPQVFRKIKFVTLLVEISSEERKESIDVKVFQETMFPCLLLLENIVRTQCFPVCEAWVANNVSGLSTFSKYRWKIIFEGICPSFNSQEVSVVD